MPSYYLLRSRFRDVSARRPVIETLVSLREQLDRDIPSKDAESRLLLATWNIRDLGKTNRRGFGDRMVESFFYIAEVISRFDFVAIQEVNEIEEWEFIMDILGPSWSYIATDVTDPKLGGNGERLLYVYDRRKVQFKNIAGEIVLPADMLISKVEVPDPNDDERELVAGKQFRRSPFLSSFQSNWFKFDICTVHLYYGAASGPKLQERIEEIERVAKYFGSRSETALRQNRALILLGDFNIVHPEHETMKKLTDEGFVIPEPIKKPANIGGDKYYDQIAFKAKDEVVEFINSTSGNRPNGGVFELFESAYALTDENVERYRAAMLETTNGRSAADLADYFKEWRTYQFSDHKPMWVSLHVNDSRNYLDSLTR